MASASIVLSDDRTCIETFTDEGRNTKKVRFKEVGKDSIDNMVVDMIPVKEVSWKEKLMGRNVSESGDVISDGDFVIEEGDILRSSINGIPAIDFSERLRNFLVRDMETTVVVKLLGQNIGYGALHNRISTLWKPSQPFCLMDIENGYFLVRFQCRVDYDLALTQAPWIVFGHYLTAQPWTIKFDPLKPFPNVVTAWIRFPGLPGFLYKKKILEEIGSLVRQVMKLDFKTDSGARGQFARMAVSIDLHKPLISQVSINGRIQRVEFEALPTVCFHCGKYGHLKTSCSSFLAEQSIQGEKEDVPVTADKDADPATVTDAFGPWMVVQCKSRRTPVEKLNQHTSLAEGNRDGSRFMALISDDNQLTDLGVDKSGIEKSGAEISGLKERAKDNMGKEIMGHNGRIGLKDKSSGPVLLEVEHGNTGKGILDDGAHTSPSPNLQNKSSSLHFNPTFEGPFESEVGRFKIARNSRVSLPDAMNSMAKLISDQVEALSDTGNASSKFIRVFHEYNREHKPDLISLMETRVSGIKADSIIVKLSFQYSHRVEAVGFSGGIWIGWKESICVEILKNHSQFVLVRISGTFFSKPLLVTFVYASPNQSKRRILWKVLQRTIPADGTPWMAIGDFNVILSPTEKRGGFRGPQFTWQRGEVMERLDRAICNNAWCTLFPISLVTHLPQLKSDYRPLKLSLMPNFLSSQGRPFRFLAVKRWNKDMYGHIPTRNKFLTKKLQNIEIERNRNNSAFLRQVEMEVREDLDNVLYHEEIL
ncbi:hypothetical protein CXB51_011564 [Gossypium anomalum]|uniref:CCHC-type domain-containing protein n=1 Tax=Gossypium anomalum TaxID=47600 RepID=A0A8J5ZEL7_9ROSI|nr:hypothetical protein CXB51_011564 [Gossypium anomalum]